MSAASGMIFDDTETDPGTMTPERADLIRRRLEEMFFSIECVGDRYPHGRLYDRRTGKPAGGWAHLVDRAE